MKTMRHTAAAVALAGSLFALAACGGGGAAPADAKPPADTGTATSQPTPGNTAPGNTAGGGQTGQPSGDKSGTQAPPSGNAAGTGDAGKSGPGEANGKTGGAAAPGGTKAGGGTNAPDGKTVQVVGKPADIAVLVNKTYKLPDNYKPDDLVEPDIPFIFKEKSEKRLMRKEAAGALEKLVAAAKKDGIALAGVSGFRSQATQKSLFDNYVKKDGEEAARMYSAVPGHSEHQTGLAMDVSGTDGKCAASDCFAGTKEAKWLAEHADEHGFIVRYPKGKESITGYQYEPWHLRYVGAKAAKDIADKGLTLEEYVLNAVPVSK
ncbi:M15 family metallopeptidase [Paenibacillus sp. GYB003]|uniref:M15 family metallopeptidase n=1 Tax=Paenibacillus sp. GYB003 TaxID=2994392 RepID=UPI002F9681D0